MEQYIKIEAKDDDGNLLGTFRLSIDINFTQSMNTIEDEELTLDNTIYNIPSNSTISLYNVPIVYEYDNKTPIQFYKGSENNINIMLLEEHKYYLSFKPSNDKNYNVFPSLLKFTDEVFELFPNNPYEGYLLFGSYVGKSYFDICRNSGGEFDANELIYQIPFEVRSRKIDYSSQYASMIGDLSKYCQNLIYEYSSPLYQSFELDNSFNQSRYEDFMLLEYLFKDENLPSTIEYLSRNLYSALTTTVEEVPTAFASNINPNDLIDVFSSSDNLYKVSCDGFSSSDGVFSDGFSSSDNVFSDGFSSSDNVFSDGFSSSSDNLYKSNSSHILSERTNGYIPQRVNETKYIDNIDVPENRFYKYFLESIEYYISKLLENIREHTYMRDKLLIYKETINNYLSQRYFKDIGFMDYIPFNSQLLQKKEGYRDILEYYLMFDFGFKLRWNEISNEFKGNEKKLFELYEYWCYFELVDVLNQLSLDDLDFEDLFKTNDVDGLLTVSLKKNQHIHFNVNICGKPIKIDLRYNTSFNKDKNNFKSYSVSLKPDYSLIINIDNKKYILHFDAKYKLNIDDESFKNEDVVKMHAYKDAIDGTVGAYVLYPGKEKKIYFESDKRLGSVGAFPLTPGEDRMNKDHLREFIVDMIEKLLDDLG